MNKYQPQYIQPLPTVIKNVLKICSNLYKSRLGCFGRPLVHEMAPGAQKSTQHHFFLFDLSVVGLISDAIFAPTGF